ncbi:glycosyltransferase, putative [Pediculus humanus corporis]|uniref:Glycosyltransferase, putative n=1 Tax=Pediculus humanus subsp. corporis TaxID=121224 RepID=E0VCY0_PEDHC|nr:glycosyltransferase, putative [Pediculus humanus corporis]EEB11236.1 glycosyltransferase, putative [Pediculus humanus corporis]
MTNVPEVSIIIPIHNGEQWINECFESILTQDILKTNGIEISVFNDASTDRTSELLLYWEKKISNINNLSLLVQHGNYDYPKGVGFAKNQAIAQCNGKYLCFQDIDDVMHPQRISLQLLEAKKYSNAIVGCQIKRIPENSTPRFSTWVNHLPQNLLSTQIYTSHGPTVLMPTWFFSKNLFKKVGLFSEKGKGTPEDLLFFYAHLDLGGTVRRVDKVLLYYRYHSNCTTFSVSEHFSIHFLHAQCIMQETIWKIRLEHLENQVLSKWINFTIWNAGKQGRKFYRSLSPSNRKKVTQFCDVDSKKTGKYYETHVNSNLLENRKIPIVHFSKVEPPIITCVKLDLTNGEFESNLKSLNMIEGKDFFIFS